ncbi:unnamed protein product [Staurois parvus]|uniref:Uncharacterized protein n=1 Tax=Staurois parvus TaxID=386267 RepID=A0ABN9ECW3_9NEOB|nr:unnamed protein product [Staurois parvus]
MFAAIVSSDLRISPTSWSTNAFIQETDLTAAKNVANISLEGPA